MFPIKIIWKKKSYAIHDHLSGTQPVQTMVGNDFRIMILQSKQNYCSSFFLPYGAKYSIRLDSFLKLVNNRQADVVPLLAPVFNLPPRMRPGWLPRAFRPHV